MGGNASYGWSPPHRMGLVFIWSLNEDWEGEGGKPAENWNLARQLRAATIGDVAQALQEVRRGLLAEGVKRFRVDWTLSPTPPR